MAEQAGKVSGSCGHDVRRPDVLDHRIRNQHNSRIMVRVNRVRAEQVFREPGFPLALVRHPRHGRSHIHRHEFHELVLILDGRTDHTLDGETYELAKGDVFLVRGEMSHGYGRGRLLLLNILFAPRRLGLPLGELRGVPGYHALFHLEPRFRRQHRFQSRLRLDMEQIGEAVRLAGMLEDELVHRSAGFRFLARARLMELIGFLCRCTSRADSPQTQRVMRMGETLSYLYKHYSEEVSLAKLAKVAHMSQSTLVRAFRSATGSSPIEYLIRLRIEHAADRLRAGDIRVTEAALACGFSDSNYFSRQFRKVMGMTPREFKRSEAVRLDVARRTRPATAAECSKWTQLSQEEKENHGVHGAA